MTPANPQNNRIVFLLAGILHLAWGIGLLLWPIGKVAAIANAVGSMGTIPAALLMIFIGAASISSTLARNHIIAACLLVGQQVVLIMSGWAAYKCAMAGQYPDKTPAMPAHIFMDQLIYIMLAVAHIAALIQTHASEWRACKPQ